MKRPAVPRLQLRLYTGQQRFDRGAALGQIHDVLQSAPRSYELQVLDGEEFRELAAEDQVAMTPMLARIRPLPVVRLAMPLSSGEALR